MSGYFLACDPPFKTINHGIPILLLIVGTTRRIAGFSSINSTYRFKRQEIGSLCCPNFEKRSLPLSNRQNGKKEYQINGPFFLLVTCTGSNQRSSPSFPFWWSLRFLCCRAGPETGHRRRIFRRKRDLEICWWLFLQGGGQGHTWPLSVSRSKFLDPHAFIPYTHSLNGTGVFAWNTQIIISRKGTVRPYFILSEP